VLQVRGDDATKLRFDLLLSITAPVKAMAENDDWEEEGAIPPGQAGGEAACTALSAVAVRFVSSFVLRTSGAVRRNGFRHTISHM
jgi:hypothetical protein